MVFGCVSGPGGGGDDNQALHCSATAHSHSNRYLMEGCRITHAQVRRSEPPPRFRSGRSRTGGLITISSTKTGLVDRLPLSTIRDISLSLFVTGELLEVHQTCRHGEATWGPRTGFSAVLSRLGRVRMVPSTWVPLGVKIQGPLLPCGPLICRGCPLSVPSQPGWGKGAFAPPQPHLSFSICCHGIRPTAWDGRMQLPRGSLAQKRLRLPQNRAEICDCWFLVHLGASWQVL